MTPTHPKIRIGIVGCGNISTIYLKNLARFPHLEVTALADLEPTRAGEQAARFGIGRALNTKELVELPDIDIVLNLTIPAAHAKVARMALENGKSVYNEKPLAASREDAAGLLELASERGLRVGCAPDTFLGAALQNARKLIDAGAIGTPVAAVAFMLSCGPERWHPNPYFFYQAGGGPMFDMGPYYLTALTVMLGPVRRVTGSARIMRKQREIGSEPLRGKLIDVEIPSHIAGILDFASGAVGTIITSFDIAGQNNLPRIEIYGTGGTMRVPDPNGFGDDQVVLNAPGSKEWQPAPSPFGYAENSRGIGLADMAQAMRSGRPHRAEGRTAEHVLDIMHAIHDSSDAGAHVELKTAMARPEPLPEGLEFGQVPE